MPGQNVPSAVHLVNHKHIFRYNYYISGRTDSVLIHGSLNIIFGKITS